MPSLDIAIPQPSVQNHLSTMRSQPLIHVQFLGYTYTCGNDKISAASAWKCLPTQKAKSVKFEAVAGHPRGDFLTKAVATIGASYLVEGKDGLGACVYQPHHVQSCPGVIKLQFATHDPEELDGREKLRRKRISNANKGCTAWNKGKKHSAETRQRIIVRTKLAMQDPKVKRKLANSGHPHSKETKVKIGTAVRMRWQIRRQRLMVQDMCYHEWRNLVAEASRKGCIGEEELQWDSYKTLEKQLKLEWLENSEQRKNMRRPEGTNRAPKPLEHRRKISLAISAKWADPEYRERVCSALAKYHGISAGSERKPRRWRSGNKKPVDACDSAGSETSTRNSKSKPNRSNMRLYKDPLVSSKLKLIKNIRARRTAAETRKNKAVQRAKLLIAEAEKAAKALEVAAMRNPLARSALAEARKLIAEAIKSIDSTKTGHFGFHENSRFPIAAPPRLVKDVEGETLRGRRTKVQAVGARESGVVDGVQPTSQIINNKKFSLGSCSFFSLLNGEEVIETSSFQDYGLPELDLSNLITQQSGSDSGSSTEQAGQHVLNGNSNVNAEKSVLGSNGLNGTGKCKQPIREVSNNSNSPTKKWVRGRFIETAESEGQGL